MVLEKDERFTKAIAPLYGKYPEELRKNIIEYNHPLLRSRDLAAPYLKQIELAYMRSDSISLIHRTAALLSSYFDILFAFNEVYHPGEKKLLKYAHVLCEKLPENFDKDIVEINNSFSDGKRLIKAVNTLLDNLDELIL